MKSRLLVILVLVVVISATGIVTATSKNIKNAPHSGITSVPQVPAKAIQQDVVDEPGVINGAKNPELIPDRVAYSLLFRFISGKQDAQAKDRIRSYVRQFGTGVKGCAESDCAKRMDSADVAAVITAADEFQRRVSPLDQQVGEIKKLQWSNLTPEIMGQLTQLQQQKDGVLAEIMASLPRRLSANGLNRLRAHINGRVKVRTKIKKNAAPGYGHVAE